MPTADRRALKRRAEMIFPCPVCGHDEARLSLVWQDWVAALCGPRPPDDDGEPNPELWCERCGEPHDDRPLGAYLGDALDDDDARFVHDYVEHARTLGRALLGGVPFRAAYGDFFVVPGRDRSRVYLLPSEPLRRGAAPASPFGAAAVRALLEAGAAVRDAATRRLVPGFGEPVVVPPVRAMVGGVDVLDEIAADLAGRGWAALHAFGAFYRLPVVVDGGATGDLLLFEPERALSSALAELKDLPG